MFLHSYDGQSRLYAVLKLLPQWTWTSTSPTLETPNNGTLGQERQTSPVKGQIVNTVGFASLTVTTIQLCYCNMKGIMDKTSRLAWLCSKKIYFKNRRWNIRALGAVVCWFQTKISPEKPPYREQMNEDHTVWEIHRPDPETPISHRICYSFAIPETKCGSF